MFESLHSHARTISPNFAREIQRIGPIEIQPTRHRTVAGHLYRSIVGQQLSTKAAQTIWSRIEQAARTNKMAVQSLFTDDHFDLLRATGVSGRKARSLIAVRQAADAILSHDGGQWDIRAANDGNGFELWSKAMNRDWTKTVIFSLESDKQKATKEIVQAVVDSSPSWRGGLRAESMETYNASLDPIED